jgi:hypothetical protein
MRRYGARGRRGGTATVTATASSVESMESPDCFSFEQAATHRALYIGIASAAAGVRVRPGVYAVPAEKVTAGGSGGVGQALHAQGTLPGPPCPCPFWSL